MPNRPSEEELLEAKQMWAQLEIEHGFDSECNRMSEVWNDLKSGDGPNNNQIGQYTNWVEKQNAWQRHMEENGHTVNPARRGEFDAFLAETRDLITEFKQHESQSSQET